MDIVHMTYARVAHDAHPGPSHPRPHDSGVDEFLKEHIDALLSSVAKDNCPTARFIDPAVREEFEQLRTGDEASFLAAAQALALRLIGRMDRRAAPGLLVCLRTSENSELSAGALKLEVVTPNAAVLELLDSGEEVLSSAKNVLDAPGHLQKGALVPGTPRARTDVIITDKLSQDALYFPTAFGIRAEQRAKAAAADVLNALNRELGPETTSRVAHAMATRPEGQLGGVLDSIAEVEPSLTPEVRQRTVDMLSTRSRPVNQVQTDAPLKEKLTADGITVSGSIEAMKAVRYSQRTDGVWEITIEVSEEPERRYQ